MSLFAFSNGYTSTCIMLTAIIDPGLEKDEVDVRFFPFPFLWRKINEKGDLDRSDNFIFLHLCRTLSGEYVEFFSSGIGLAIV